MSYDHAESSGQALERFLSKQLEALSLQVSPDDVEYMARFIEEEGLERDEKVEGVRGMLEGVVEGGISPDEGLDAAVGCVVDEWSRLREEQLEKAAREVETDSPPPEANIKNILSNLTDEELAAARKQSLLRQYGYVEGGPEDEIMAREGPQRGDAAKTTEEKKAAEERRALIEAALKLDAKKKKYKKQQELDLMAPNLNRDKVAYKAQMEREAARKGAQERKDRDKAALDKQRADAAKAKADKQKKAAKQERRA